MVHRCTMGGLGWTLGSIGLLRGWLNAATGFLVDAPCLSVFKRHLSNALSNNLLYFLVSPEVVMQLD